jgi:hypothetical protein
LPTPLHIPPPTITYLSPALFSSAHVDLVAGLSQRNELCATEIASFSRRTRGPPDGRSSQGSHGVPAQRAAPPPCRAPRSDPGLTTVVVSRALRELIGSDLGAAAPARRKQRRRSSARPPRPPRAARRTRPRRRPPGHQPRASPGSRRSPAAASARASTADGRSKASLPSRVSRHARWPLPSSTTQPYRRQQPKAASSCACVAVGHCARTPERSTASGTAPRLASSCRKSIASSPVTPDRTAPDGAADSPRICRGSP